MKMTNEKFLHKLYYTPGLPTSYGSIGRIFKAAKVLNKNISKNEIENWLLKQDAYTLHKLAKKKLAAEPRVYVKTIDEQWAADLCDVSNISIHNDGYNFILTTIDVLSKWANAEPIKNKSGINTAEAFREIFRKTKRRPQKIETDHGKEFYNKQFKKLCDEEGIQHFSTESSNKACVAERFNRTIKELLYRHFSANNTYRWLEVLPKMLETYNNRFHRSIGCKPNEVTVDNEIDVYRKLYHKKPRWGKKYNVGDFVRISRKRHIFDKGYLPQFTEEVFKISKVFKNHRPYRYEIQDMMGEDIGGKFASEELQKTIKDDQDMWKIDKIIKTVRKPRGIFYLVQWRGFPEKFNSLVNAKDIIKLS